tara:strand:- start:2440 stop:4557 length:2118 start_codon:yes stop_codon:yes gene_type:complete
MKLHFLYKNVLLQILALILLFALPIYFFGIKDREDYDLGLFSSKVIFENFNLFIFFYDLYGPGIKFPIGQGLFFHPLTIFINSVSLFFFIVIFSHILIQINYFFKLLKQYKINNSKFVIITLVVFSISNFNYIYSDDWLSLFVTYTFLFVSFYYWNKVIYKRTNIAFVQFILSISFMVLNGHSGLAFIYLAFLILYFLFNFNYAIIKNKLTYLFLFLFLILVGEYAFWLIEDLISYETSEKNVQFSYQIKHYVVALLSPFFPAIGAWINEYIVLDIQTNRLPTYNINIIFSLFYSIYIFMIGKSKEFKNLNYIFIILFIISLSSNTKYLYILPGVWQIRDILNLISFLFIAKFLVGNFFYIKLFKLIIFSYVIIFFLGNIIINTSANLNIKNYLFINHLEFAKQIFHESNLKYQPTNNYIINKYENSKVRNTIKNINTSSNFERIYLGDKFYSLLINKHSPLREHGIYGPTDLAKFNLINFNAFLKNSSFESLAKAERKLYSEIRPNEKDYNSQLFLNIFQIKFLLLSEEEFNNTLNKTNFKIVSEFYFNNDLFKVLEINNSDDKIVLSNENVREIALLNECNLNLRECIGKIEALGLYQNESLIKFERISLNTYNIQNITPETVNIIFPFIYNENWSSKKEIKNVGKYLSFITLDKGQITQINYFYKLRFILKLISIFTFFFLVIYTIYLKFNKKFKSEKRKYS